MWIELYNLHAVMCKYMQIVCNLTVYECSVPDKQHKILGGNHFVSSKASTHMILL